MYRSAENFPPFAVLPLWRGGFYRAARSRGTRWRRSVSKVWEGGGGGGEGRGRGRGRGGSRLRFPPETQRCFLT